MKVDAVRANRLVRVCANTAVGLFGSLALVGCGSSATSAPPWVAVTVVTTVDAPTISETSVEATPTTTATPGASIDYTVVAGDGLWGIATRHCTTLDELIATNGWSDGSSHLLHPGDVIKLPDVPCTSTPPTSMSGQVETCEFSDPQSLDPECVFIQVVFWDYADGGEYEGEFTDPTCTAAYGANFAIERGQTDDVDAAITGLELLSIPIPDDLRGYLEKKAAIFHTYGEDLRRISDTYWNGAGEDAAKADPAYATVAAVIIDAINAIPARSGTSLIQDACDQFQVGDE